MYTAHVIVRGFYKSFSHESSDKAMQFVESQTFNHSVGVDKWNGAKGAFYSIHDGNTVVGHYVIEKD